MELATCSGARQEAASLRIRSLRMRLTIWNVVVLVAVLLAFSGGTIFANRQRMAAGMDRELRERALRSPGGGPPPGQGGGGFGSNARAQNPPGGQVDNGQDRGGVDSPNLP